VDVKIERRKTKEIKVGNLLIGGGNPVVIQEMTMAPASDVEGSVRQIQRMEEIGLRLVRVAVPDQESALSIRQIKEKIGIPLVADIQFDSRLALLAVEAGADKLRINPGNIGSRSKLSDVVSAAKERAVPIRVGVNTGSLGKSLIERFGGKTVRAMVESALLEVALLEKLGFYDIVISLKSTDIGLVVGANLEMAEKVSYPLHLGVTESGFGQDGILLSLSGLSPLLMGGIGDTLRISLTNQDRLENIILCQKVLGSLHIPWV
jgi:(E)-4-hydroxy-3-methylbut-2-enyl-diphosphate synthase